MAADIDLQAWLEKDSISHPPIVTPYVQSTESRRFDYKVIVISQGRGARAQLSQNGSVLAQAGQATALPPFSISVDSNEKCRVELVLITEHDAAKNYYFDCPQ